MKKNYLANALLVFVFACPVLSTQAQDRQDETRPQLTQKTQGMHTATGWTKDRDGKWIGNPNIIDSYKYSNAPTDESFSHNPGFRWFRSASLAYNGKNYKILYYSGEQGEYKYPLTKVDWNTWSVAKGMIVEEDEFKKFQSDLQSQKGSTVVLKSKIDFSSYNGDTDEGRMLSNVMDAIKRGGTIDICLEATAQTTKDGDVVRFRLPGYCQMNKEDDLKESYFETTIPEFNKMLVYDGQVSEEDMKTTDAIMKSWKTADTLRAESCTWIAKDKKATPYEEFKWAVMSTFMYGKDKYYALSTKAGKTTKVTIFTEDQYKNFKAALAAQAPGDNYLPARMQDNASFVSTDSDLKESIHMYLGMKESALTPCMGINIKKGRVKFHLPDDTCSKLYGVGDGNDWHAFECSLTDFNKLFPY